MVTDRELNAEPSAGGRAVKLWSLVLRHIVLISFTTAVGAALGYLQFLRTPPTYQSSCSLLVRNESNNKNIPFQGTETYSPNQREQPHALLIASPLVVERALDKELDSGSGSDQSKRRLRDLPSLANLDNPAAHIGFRLVARTGLQNGVENPNILNLSYRDADALTTKAVLDAVIESYQDFLGESHRNVSKDVLDLIEDARNSLMKQLIDIENRYTQFRQDTPLLFHGEQKATNVHKDRMSEIEQARAKLLILITERRAELQSIQDALTRGGSREAITLMLQAMKPDSRAAEAGIKSPASKIFELMLDEQLLLLDLGPEHPKVKALQKRISLTQDFHLNEMPEDERPKKKSRGDFLTVCIDSIRHEISSIESKIMELDELFEIERHASRSIAVYEVKNENFQKELVRTEALYQGVVKRLDELNLLQDYGGYKTAIISPAGIGGHISPVFSQSLLIGAICGAAIGFGLGYLFEANDKTFRSPEEVSDYLGLPIVGHVPVIEHKVTGLTTTSLLDPMLVTFFKPKSPLSESYRAIRTSLYFSTRGEQHKVIQVTSPNPGDGKTTLSANLAVSIAQSGKKVLMIDADFRRPRIHQLLALDRSIGISSVISGDAELPDAIQATEVENLWALGCGPRPSNPCELLTSRRFEELLEILREQYDFVIIDTPPLLAVTDPSAVAARVDGVLLTIRLSKRTRGEATKAKELLASLGANTLGVVVNGIGKNSSYGSGQGYSSYNSYNYTSHYGYGSDEDSVYYASDDETDEAGDRAKQRAHSSRKTSK